MISEIFKALLITSLTGSVLAIVISLLRPITKRIFGYSWHYYIWLCVLFVMLMPVRFNVNPTPTPSVTTQTAQTQQEAVNEQPVTTENIIQADTAQKPQLLQKATVIWNRIIYNRMRILAYLWLIGAIALMLLNVVRYVRLDIKIRKNCEVISCPEISEYTDRKINVRVWENVASPFMTGIFRPTLVLSKMELSSEQLHNILRHEMTHFKRHDILYKWFAEFVKCVHWFNPTSWYVSKQIAAECEISCDMSVTKNMTDSEKMSYVGTILSLLPTGKAKQIPLTTQMASSKKILKRRFIMIRNKKTTSRFMSVISAVIAVILFSTTVFASGVLSDLTTDDYTIEILNNGEKIELTNKPFIENGEVYVPLRETLEKLGFDKNNSNIVWKDGKVGLSLVQTNGHAGAYCIQIGYKGVWCSQESTVLDDTALNYIIDNSRGYIDFANSVPPILKNSLTYISIKDFDYIIYRFLNVRNENNELYKLTYNVYDKNGDEINLQPFSYDEVSAARAVVEEYFKAANEKGKRGELTTLTAWHNAPNVVLTSDSDVFLTLNNIQYDANDPCREEYVKSGRGSVNNTSVDNVIVFRVDYDVSIPQDGYAGAYNEGNYSDWKMILIRDNKDGKWLIDDMGY